MVCCWLELTSIRLSSPLTSSMYLFFQLCASRRWSAVVKDAKTAFLDQLILLLAEVYGLVSGPAWWRRSLLEVLVKELGYRVNPYDRCVLTLDNDDATKGEDEPNLTWGIEVDDLLESGDKLHREKMDWLEKRLKFGKFVNLMETPSGTGYAGRRVRQHQDGSVTYTMDDYVHNRLKYVSIDRKVLKKDHNTPLLNADGELGIQRRTSRWSGSCLHSRRLLSRAEGFGRHGDQQGDHQPQEPASAVKDAPDT